MIQAQPETSADRTIGLIAGNGQFPLLFARTARAKGWQVHAVAYREETDPRLADHVESLEWLYLGQLKRMLKFFHQRRVSQAVMLGGITKTRFLSKFRPDMKTIALLAGMRHTHDDAVLRAFAEFLEKEGIAIRPSTFLLPDLLAPPGIWTIRKPSSTEMNDIRVGWKMAKAIGALDIGQCVLVAGGTAVAVEAVDGTDATILRGGALSKGQAVVVKVCKPIQDTRFDVPAIGLETIETMQRANVKALAIEAGKAVVFDREAMIRQADRYGMTITAMTDDTL
ncbi:LpxI family protein [Desulfatitalea alkaliphila]|uniref:UDP-2,3-diacylglucosamine diphosphatase LpxI n=1 Tax=Desulfatitalea alkaliphila TaxID=2929485 RepID=A0AA41R2A3_9BACT|nr:UDP-2,3-diacylglucosamine diphosphatase LpxI [Desulfatitalea alkaliphila]